jgi:hypothetical protein
LKTISELENWWSLGKKLRIKESFHLLPVISETTKNWECS